MLKGFGLECLGVKEEWKIYFGNYIDFFQCEGNEEIGVKVLVVNNVGVVCGNLIILLYGSMEVNVFIYILFDNFIKVSELEWIFLYFFILKLYYCFIYVKKVFLVF